MKKGDLFSCMSKDCCLELHSEGLWKIIQKTDKTLKLERIGNVKYVGWVDDTLVCREERNRNPVIYYDDGDFTVYPNRAGIPFIFTPYKK